MRVAIVDDLPEDSEKLLADVWRWAEETQTPLVPPPSLFDSGEALLDSMTEGSFDVIFLDIYMNGMNGMETARKIRETDQSCRLIFTTLTPDFAVESYDVESSYYLVKPYSYQKLSLALNRCGISALEQEQFITIPGRLGEERLYLHDIVYTEYINRRITVHMKDGTCRSVAMRQSDFADALLEYPYFCDCIKGVLVNFEMVNQLQKDRFLLKNGQYIPISRLKYQSVREQFLEFSYAQTRGINYDRNHM
ncbi:MAG: LytTR family DNA-binding domain-containing protein [Eubacteriales bacterium]|nr:LytTR family DNA-binding domain-containing protein [Eubacteriales bacterium]